MTAPDKESRKKCWKARDAYFSCLDSNGLWLHGLKPESFEEIVKIDPITPPIRNERDRSLSKDQKKILFTCKKAFEMYNSDCLPSWISHFAMIRVKDLQKEALKRNLEEKESKLEQNDAEFWKNVSRKE